MRPGALRRLLDQPDRHRFETGGVANVGQHRGQLLEGGDVRGVGLQHAEGDADRLVRRCPAEASTRDNASLADVCAGFEASLVRKDCASPMRLSDAAARINASSAAGSSGLAVSDRARSS